MATKREELEQYKERVFQELRLRGERVKELDTKLASIKYLIDGVRTSGALKSGDTVRVLTQASYRAKLRRDLDDLERKRREAFDDLKRAEVRLEDVMSELEELEDRESEEQVGETAIEDEGDE